MSLPLLFIPLEQVAVGNLHEWNTGGTKAGTETLQEPPGSYAGKGIARTQKGEASGQCWVSGQGDQDLQKQPEEESSSKLADERLGQWDRAAEEGGLGKECLAYWGRVVKMVERARWPQDTACGTWQRVGLALPRWKRVAGKKIFCVPS